MKRKNHSKCTGTQIYHKEEYIIITARRGYVVINTKKEKKYKDFKDCHTHIRSFEQAKGLIYLARTNKLPYDLKPYFLVSLLRISDDPNYTAKVQELLDTKTSKNGSNVRKRKAAWSFIFDFFLLKIYNVYNLYYIFFDVLPNIYRGYCFTFEHY